MQTVNKNGLKELARAIKNIDNALFWFDWNKEEISQSRKLLMDTIFHAGYELNNHYRLIKIK